MRRSNAKVHGVEIDDETRCRHYNSDTDIMGIKFKCCGRYYACFSCHEELESHEVTVWPKSEFDEKAVICGKCRFEFSIRRYLDSDFTCPSCGSRFNEGCKLHYHLYFEEWTV